MTPPAGPPGPVGPGGRAGPGRAGVGWSGGRPRPLLLDVDGVLVDSTAALRWVWASWAGERALDPAEVWRRCQGRRPEDTLRAVAPDLDPRVERRALDALLRRCPHRLPAVAGARQLLGRLPAGRWAIVTSGDRRFVAEAFAGNGLPLPAVRVYGDDVPAGKPAPDGYLLAARRLRVAPEDCVVVEDSPAGVAAARAAGCTVIAVGTTHPAGELREADEFFPSLRAAAARLRGLAR